MPKATTWGTPFTQREIFMQKFGKTFLVPIIAAAMLTMSASSTAWAQPKPLNVFKNLGKTVEADPNKEYKLTEMEGPYFILATALVGPTARQDAHELVLELRSKHKWNAYVFEKNFARNANQDFGRTQNSQYRTTIKYNTESTSQFVVLIGNFPSLDDNQFKKTLEEVRLTKPESLKGKTSVTSFSFPNAFGVTNPMLPPEHQQKTVDAFIESINKGPYSLLRNPRRYTVQVAVFTGRAAVDPKNIRNVEEGKISFEKETSALDIAERAATTLCQALRARGIEAYEFHDRYSSIVTIGGFDQSDNSYIPQIVQKYKGQTINGIRCIDQPRPIEVPRVARR